MKAIGIVCFWFADPRGPAIDEDDIGNRAAHGGDEVVFTSDEAIRFRELVNRAIKEVQFEATSRSG